MRVSLSERRATFEGGRLDIVQYYRLDRGSVGAEIERFNSALETSREELKRIKKKLVGGVGKEHSRIIDAHLMILKDQMLIDDTVKIIKKDMVNSEWALKKVLKGVKEFFNKMDNEYLKERSSDIEHIVNRILLNLMDRKQESLADLSEPAVIIAHDLAPTDTAQMSKDKVQGFLTDVGGRTSHTAIIARSLEIPSVVGLEDVSRNVETGDIVVIDGTTGTVIINPSPSVIDVYEKRREKFEKYGLTLREYKDLPSETTDGKRVTITGNMEMEQEIDALIEHGAEGIGLFRSEFLYLNRHDFPTEAEQMRAYKDVVKRMAPNPVVIRTLDVGGEKLLMHASDGTDEVNPALGLRAIRYCLKRARYI